MRILYCGLRASWTLKGHKYFDVKWAHLLSSLAEVTLCYFEDGWYEDVNENIRKEVFDAAEQLERKKWINWSLWSRWQWKRLAIKDHAECNFYIKKVLELSERKPYDYIVISTMDLISYFLYRNRLRKAAKLMLIVHSVDGFQNGILNKIFMKVKDDFHYIVMEEEGVHAMNSLYGIARSNIHYIPHMLNPVTKHLHSMHPAYDIVGISNSNADEEVRKIIELEKKEHFFENNGLRALFRSKNIAFCSKGLHVFKGRLGFTYDEYYTYITKARVIVLPFGRQFGLRSSGTMIDAFSQGIPVIGNPFQTMLQYHRLIPDICKLYTTMEEFKGSVLELLTGNETYKEEYRLFINGHSDEFILGQMKKAFT